MWYLYVSDVGSLPPAVAADYGRLGALVSVANKRSSDVPGCTWVELDPSSIPEASWDEAAQTLVDSGSRFNTSWANLWDELTDAEQDAVFDLAASNANANRVMRRIEFSIAKRGAEGEKEIVDKRGAKVQAVLDFLVSQGILTTQRKDEIVGV